VARILIIGIELQNIHFKLIEKSRQSIYESTEYVDKNKKLGKPQILSFGTNIYEIFREYPKNPKSKDTNSKYKD
jgi:hypothetical protein